MDPERVEECVKVAREHINAAIQASLEFYRGAKLTKEEFTLLLKLDIAMAKELQCASYCLDVILMELLPPERKHKDPRLCNGTETGEHDWKLVDGHYGMLSRCSVCRAEVSHEPGQDPNQVWFEEEL